MGVRRLHRRRLALAAGLLALASLLTAWSDLGLGFGAAPREAAFDRLLAAFPRAGREGEVVVVDIDRAALAQGGAWPWPRERLAALLRPILAAAPKAVALDMLLPERGDAPGDAALARLFAGGRVILGAALDPESDAPVTQGPLPVVVRAPLALEAPMQAAGLDAPAASLREGASLGVLSLGGPAGGTVRRAPLLAVAGGVPLPGLAFEAVRQASGASTVFLAGDPPVVTVADLAIRAGRDGAIRLHFAGDAARTARRVSARDVLNGTVPAARFAGRIVLVGAGAPEAGGLRRTAIDPFLPSVEIHAEAAAQIISGEIPRRPVRAPLAEAAASLGLGALAALAGAVLSPLAGLGLATTMAAAWLAGVVALFLAGGWLLDPAGPVLAVLAGVQAAAIVAFAVTRRERRAIERRFAQHLAPEVVRRIADNPRELRLGGEARMVTALFTDIEGFTALSERADPEEVIRILDVYLDRVCAIVVAHGGMVDKIVGDAVHALFNVPVDLDDHTARAVACARAIIAGTEAVRREALPARHALGRTRIGIEAGRAVVGEVGGGLRLDYTAHGMAINTAARLEQANKRFGTSILLGPVARARVPGVDARPVGAIRPSEASPEIEVFAVDPGQEAGPAAGRLS